ncbi:MAG: selenocysteine-specific translation elongation factor [Deltaproteobacteria bacterium]|nr:MAG: selenocysteine-specific translation elongation factor [Deltaproteobacteria bacterium]
MREIVLGTAGHVDHGKTSFIRALTGFETDRLQEEKKRGITIELGFAYLDLACGHRVGIVDVPGHEKFVKTMVSGVSGIDILAFVVAADEGIMPQTVEHFEICRLMGVRQGLVVVTKIDLVDAEWLEMVSEEIESFCQGSFLEDAPILKVSSTSGEGIEEVRHTINNIVKGHDFQEAHGPFRLAVDRIFAMKGFGAVVTGTSISGRTALGADLQLYPGTRVAKVRGLQVHSSAVAEVEAGHRTAINLQGVGVDEIHRGMVVAPEKTMEPSYMLDCRLLYLGANSKPLKHRARLRVHLGTSEIIGRVSLLDRDVLQPGEEAVVQLLLEEKAVVWPGDNYVVRSYSPVVTVGGGTVYGNVSPRKRKRLSAADREYNRRLYQILKDGSDEDKILFFLQESREQGLTADQLGVRLGIFGNRLKKVLQQPISAKKIVVVDSVIQRFVSFEITEHIKGLFVEYLASFHKKFPLLPGLSKEELRTGVGRRIDDKLYTYCISDLLRKNQVIQEDSVVRLPEHRVTLQADEEQLQAELNAWYRKSGLSTPTIKETLARFADYPEKMVRELIAVNVREKRLRKINESLYYAKEVIDPLIDSVQRHIEAHGEIDTPAFKELTGLTRKFSIPILEYLDREKITRRVGDKRILRKKRS